MNNLYELILITGCIAWWTTALVGKDGPFKILKKFRDLLFRVLRDNTPLKCYHCTSFWVGLVTISLYVNGDYLLRALIAFFGALGLAQALRGLSGEWQ